jgi:hypothetical protein
VLAHIIISLEGIEREGWKGFTHGIVREGSRCEFSARNWVKRSVQLWSWLSWLTAEWWLYEGEWGDMGGNWVGLRSYFFFLVSAYLGEFSLTRFLVVFNWRSIGICTRSMAEGDSSILPRNIYTDWIHPTDLSKFALETHGETKIAHTYLLPKSITRHWKIPPLK